MTVIISLDTETTGLDLRHGALPFFVTICDEDGRQQWWEWDVDPLTRKVHIPPGDMVEIHTLIDDADEVVLHNAKFDHAALCAAGFFTGQDRGITWDWGKVQDTMLASHILASNQPHNLTDLAMHYLGTNILPLEDALEAAVQSARRKVRTNYPSWRIAKAGYPDMPSAREKTWKFDTWLPRVFLNLTGVESEESLDNHPWQTVLRDYANADTAVTTGLWQVFREELCKRDLWDIYRERMKILPIVAGMEHKGITLSSLRLEQLRCEYEDESRRLGRVCVNVAHTYGYDLEMPRSAVNNRSLIEFCFGKSTTGAKDGPRTREKDPTCLNLSPMKASKKTGTPSLDRATLEYLTATLDPSSRGSLFVKSLKDKRSRDTAQTYMQGYERFMLPLPDEGWFVLHPSLNVTGTATLRLSSSNPNEQNVSAREGFNLRHCFGPSPGREWWSMDAKNIELRLPAYEAGEKVMIDLFERPDDPPYYGSNHLLSFHTVYRDIWAEVEREVGYEKVGPVCRERFKYTWYRSCKSGNFCKQYGGQRTLTDATFRRQGAYDLLESRLSGIAALSTRCIRMADRLGYVETIPDRTVNPRRGYPLLCTRTENGKVLPTVPLSYHIQGTACWVLARMMVLVQDYLDDLNKEITDPKSKYYLIMNIHDEVVLDFPFRENKGNLPIIMELKSMMDKVGLDLIPPVPCPVGAEYHPVTWAEGETVA